MRPGSTRFVVLKFGGTSVARKESWATIAAESRAVLAAGFRPLLVCSALSGVTDLLARLLAAALAGAHGPLLQELRERHLVMGSELGIDRPEPLLEEDFAELERLVTGIALLKDASPRIRARLLAFGELLSTRLGAESLRRSGLSVAWIDARDCLAAEEEPGHADARRYLAATVSDDADPELVQRLGALAEDVLITQGFIARGPEGATVLLGRGGSDTSAALFAARLGAERCEIWTDVPGVFSAHPQRVPGARLLRALDYDEAQEIASMGSKVLHPRSIAPCRRHRIPILIRWTERPSVEGTRIAPLPAGEAQVKAISSKPGVTLISMETSGMWQQVGFLAEVFACFRRHGLSVDLVSTSEMNVTVTLDPIANALDPGMVEELVADLERHCRVRVIGPCGVVSLVGRSIRAILHRLGPVLSVFEEKEVHLVSQAASDLNLTFVVEEEEAEKLVRALHAHLFDADAPGSGMGPTWAELTREAEPGGRTPDGVSVWWRSRREALLELAREETPLYVYHGETAAGAARSILAIPGVDRVFYALKANAHESLVRLLEGEGLSFECVSRGEMEHVHALLPGLDPTRILFTPNFAARDEYAFALERGHWVGVDNLHPLARWPAIFRGREILLRVDPGRGKGHHSHVRTAGARSKFGIPISDLPEAKRLAVEAGARVVGLHAHVGSGILAAHTWAETAALLAALLPQFEDVRILDLGGGFGVPERSGQAPLDLAAVGAQLARVCALVPGVQLWLEPGRFLVAESGVLLARVTQVKSKDATLFVGTDAGMNSLIRPALYGAYHEIVNLSRLDETPSMTAHVVGPICESADVLGHARELPHTEEGDVLLIATAGAYGAVMASRYNLRAPAGERLL